MLTLAAAVASAAGLAVQLLPRSFSAAQRQQIMSWEMGKRWRMWPAGKIFPGQVRYDIPGPALGAANDLVLTAHRVGIAPQSSCQRATDPAAAAVLIRHGCLAVLRATYDDATQSLVATVGIAVLPSIGAAARARGGLSTGPGVRAVPFRGTPAASFGDPQRQVWLVRAAGPYLIFATAGYADGRRRIPGGNPYAYAEMLGVAHGITGWVAAHLGAAPPPPHCPGAPGC